MIMGDIKIEIGGQEYYLLYNGAAMFAIDDGGNISDRLWDTSAAGFDWICQAVAVLAEQGELARRYMGYDKGPLLTADAVKALTMPIDIIQLRQAVFRAVMAGYGREIKDDDQEIDLGLVELQKKTTSD